MMLEKALTHLTSQIDEKVARLQDALGTGVAKDYSEYQKICGEVQGLLTARLYIKDLARNIEDSDE
jgi:hypothetical protein